MSDDDVFTKIVLLLIIVLVHVAASGEGEASNGDVPNVYKPVAVARGEGVVFLMEGDGVHWVNVFDTILLQSVTFESVCLPLCLGRGIELLHRDPALDAAEHVAGLVGEAADTAGLVLEAALSLLLRTRHVAQVPDEHLPPRRDHHKLLPRHRHGEHLVRLVISSK